MGMGGSARIARGVWITGGPGFAGALLAFRLLEVGAIAIMALVAGVMTIALVATLAIWQSRDTARRKLTRQLLADRVRPEVVRIVAGRSDPPVWGVYLMGSDLYTGPETPRLAGQAIPAPVGSALRGAYARRQACECRSSAASAIRLLGQRADTSIPNEIRCANHGPRNGALSAPRVGRTTPVGSRRTQRITHA